MCLQIVILALLLKWNADFDSRDRMGCTSLWFSVLSGHKKVATLLLERGANEYVLDNNGVAMLEYVMSMKM